MIDGFIELLRRQCAAAEHLETRLRALELAVAVDDRALVEASLAEVEVASERLSGLELARTLVVSTVGLPPDATATELLRHLDMGDREEPVARLASVIAELRRHAELLWDARHRDVGDLRRQTLPR